MQEHFYTTLGVQLIFQSACDLSMRPPGAYVFDVPTPLLYNYLM